MMHVDARRAVDEASPQQRVAWGIAIAAASMLLAAVVVDVVVRANLLQWWLPVSLLAGIVAADFGSGVVHWGADTWGRADLPVIGPRLLLPFRVHHLYPEDFLRRRFLDTNGDVAALTIPVLLGLFFMPRDTGSQQAIGVFGVGFCGMAMMTNQIHQWAHTASPPPPVRVLQELRLLLPPEAHATHHDRPYDAHYCITTGWCNRPLEAVAFFPRLEAVITRLTGAVPRQDELPPCTTGTRAQGSAQHD
jgi:plasmanylethanolamine desaturase